MGRPKKIHVDTEAPIWCCYICGSRYGSFKAGQVHTYYDECGACGITTSVVEPKHYGYFLQGWREVRDADRIGKLHSFSEENLKRRKKYKLQFEHREV